MRPRDVRCPHAFEGVCFTAQDCLPRRHQGELYLRTSCCQLLPTSFHIPTGHGVVRKLWSAVPIKYANLFWWGPTPAHLPGGTCHRVGGGGDGLSENHPPRPPTRGLTTANTYHPLAYPGTQHPPTYPGTHLPRQHPPTYPGAQNLPTPNPPPTTLSTYPTSTPHLPYLPYTYPTPYVGNVLGVLLVGCWIDN